MTATLEIVRAAFLGLARRLGPWLVGLTVLAGLGWYLDSTVTGVLLVIGMVVALGGGLPALVGAGLRRWMHAGPLGLAYGGGSFSASLAYGLGAALLAAPFAGLASWALLRPSDDSRFETIAFTMLSVLILAWLGAAASRVAASPVAIVLVTWLLGALVAAGSGLTAMSLRDPLAGTALLGQVPVHLLAESVWLGGGVLLTLLALAGASALDPRLLPSRLEK